jgi:hypothetical protein
LPTSIFASHNCDLVNVFVHTGGYVVEWYPVDDSTEDEIRTDRITRRKLEKLTCRIKNENLVPMGNDRTDIIAGLDTFSTPAVTNAVVAAPSPTTFSSCPSRQSNKQLYVRSEVEGSDSSATTRAAELRMMRGGTSFDEPRKIHNKSGFGSSTPINNASSKLAAPPYVGPGNVGWSYWEALPAKAFRRELSKRAIPDKPYFDGYWNRNQFTNRVAGILHIMWDDGAVLMGSLCLVQGLSNIDCDPSEMKWEGRMVLPKDFFDGETCQQ